MAGAETIIDGSRAMLDAKWIYWEGPGFKSAMPIKWQIVPDPVDSGTCVMTDDRAADGGKFGAADIVTKKPYRDFRLHIEFFVMKAGGNSGVYLQNRFEIQIFDGDKTKHGMGAVINETESPYDLYLGLGKWNSYDIVFRAARFVDGKMTQKPLVSMYFNGKKAHTNVAINQVWGGARSALMEVTTAARASPTPRRASSCNARGTTCVSAMRGSRNSISPSRTRISESIGGHERELIFFLPVTSDTPQGTRMKLTKHWRKSSLPGFAVVLALCFASQLPAEEPAASAAMPAAAELFADQPKGLSEHIIAWKLLYVSEVLGNPVGGEKQGAVYEGYVKFGIGVNLDRALGWEDASLYANVLYPHGASLTQNFAHDLNGISNIDGYDSVRLYKLWFQKNFDDFRFSFRIGQMAADKEFFTADTAGVFLNNAFGTPAIFSQNITGPIYPVSAPGVRLRWEPSPAFSLRAAVFSGDVGSATANQHQTRILLPKEGGALVLIEAAYKTHQARGDDRLPGTFKLGGYYDSKWFDDDSDGNRHHGDSGTYFVADQLIYREKNSGDAPRGLSIYSRVGLAPRDHNLVNFEYEGGLNYVGLLRNRPRDIAGLGLVYTHISGEVQPSSDGPAPGSHESLLEAVYLAPINDWCTVQPDLQFIMHPGANALHRNALVLGLRVSLSF